MLFGICQVFFQKNFYEFLYSGVYIYANFARHGPGRATEENGPGFTRPIPHRRAIRRKCWRSTRPRFRLCRGTIPLLAFGFRCIRPCACSCSIAVLPFGIPLSFLSVCIITHILGFVKYFFKKFFAPCGPGTKGENITLLGRLKINILYRGCALILNIRLFLLSRRPGHISAGHQGRCRV